MVLCRSILIADDDPTARHALTQEMSGLGYEARAVVSGAALEELSTRDYDVLLWDAGVRRGEDLTVPRQALARHPELTVVVMSAHASRTQALEALDAGAHDYVRKPLSAGEFELVLGKVEARERARRGGHRSEGDKREFGGGALLGESEPMRALMRQVERLAPVSTTVLITGESGTGKELVARALHGHSPRAHRPFVAVNCGAMPAGLLESELFGHARGAFTDARTARRGLFGEADGGTLFLDEVGELSAPAQVTLLRALQEREIRPVGDSRAERVDVRVIAATLRDLDQLVARGEFREDLYYRLNVVNVRVPPLRERPGDVPLLARACLERFNRELQRASPVLGLTSEALALLSAWPWPGNVRELENVLERAVLLAEGPWVLPQHLPERLQSPPSWVSPQAPIPTRPPAEADLSLKRATRALEESYIRAALRFTRGNRTRAATVLEISARSLLYKIKEYGIDADAEGGRG